MAEINRKRTSESWRSPDQPINDRRTPGERRESSDPVAEEHRVVERRSSDRRRRMLARIGLGIDYLFFLLYGLLALRLLLALVGANEQAGFVEFVHGVSGPFYAPFSNIVASPAINGGQLDLPALIALFVYGLLHLAAKKLLRVIAGPPESARSGSV